MLLLRQILFNILFYGYMAIFFIFLSLFLACPRKFYMRLLKIYFVSNTYIEKYVMGLDYEVRGAEHIPADGSYLVAGKHFSTYETYKLLILFKDPSVILKRELVLIPIWGWLALKAGAIPIDRSSGHTAMRSILKGTERLKKEGRPIVIFPQGTRVSVTDTPETKPYKFGIIRMQESAGLPIIPMATNSGLFWPRRAFAIKPGKIIFEFFPAIPADGNTQENFKKMIAVIEDNSNRLIQETLSQT